MDKYIHTAIEKHGYNREQALAMLFWHKHDMDRALQDLANFTPVPNEWSMDDKLLFEQAFKVISQPVAIVLILWSDSREVFQAYPADVAREEYWVSSAALLWVGPTFVVALI